MGLGHREGRTFHGFFIVLTREGLRLKEVAPA
jgi:hypothetical protein